MFKYILILIIVALVCIQFITIDTSDIAYEKSKDFINLTEPEADIKNMLINSCYDCHSYNTEYPWYSNVAPVSWWLAEHIEDGRRHLNYSVWEDYPLKKKKHKIEEMIEMVEDEEMPLTSYTLIHGKTSLSKEQQEKLINWLKETDRKLE